MSRTEQIGQAGSDKFPSASAQPQPTISRQEELRMRVAFTKNIGMLLLGIWLILMGLVSSVPLVASLGILLSFLAIAAGVLILIGR
jgi:hypothetical protein